MSKVPPKSAPLGKEPKKKRMAAAGGPSKPAEMPLSVEERIELKGIFSNPVFVKAFNNARLCKPPVYVGGLATQFGGQIATIQIARIQGWEAFEAAMFLQTQDKLPKPAPLEENFADPQLPPIK